MNKEKIKKELNNKYSLFFPGELFKYGRISYHIGFISSFCFFKISSTIRNIVFLQDLKKEIMENVL